MIPREFFDPTNLSKAQTLYIYEVVKIVVIYKKKNLIFTIFQIVPPSFKSFDNCQKVVIISLVSNFYRYHLSKKKNTTRYY